MSIYVDHLKGVILYTLEIMESLTEGKIKLSENAADLLLMTAAHESLGGKYLKQVGGPALGIYGMEPTTFRSINDNYLDYRPELKRAGMSLSLNELSNPAEVIYNLVLATYMARIQYFKVPKALPDNEEGMAAYAKKYWNTEKGKATEEKYLTDYRRYVYV